MPYRKDLFGLDWHYVKTYDDDVHNKGACGHVFSASSRSIFSSQVDANLICRKCLAKQASIFTKSEYYITRNCINCKYLRGHGQKYCYAFSKKGKLIKDRFQASCVRFECIEGLENRQSDLSKIIWISLKENKNNKEG